MTFYIQTIPGAIELHQGDVHIWFVNTDAWNEITLPDVLSDAEKQRQSRLRSELDRQRFLVTRVAIREILSAYLESSPEALRFDTTAAGKPYVVSSQRPISFNIAHSGSACLIAVGGFEHIGVDIEEKKPARDLPGVAERFFAPTEARVVERLPENRRLDAFYAIWCRKEAYVKALGSGISGGLDKFEVSVSPDEPASLLHIEGQSDELFNWTLRDLPAPDGYAAALAVRGKPQNVLFLEWKRPL